MTIFDQATVLEEVTVALRNADILTTTQRSVTTTSATGTLSSATSLLINSSSVKNVRSVTVATVVLSFGSDYTVDYDYNDAGTYKCKITFSTAQSGAYSVSYDYGTDKIFYDYPRSDLKLSSFPRIAVGFIDVSSEVGGMGNVNLNRYDLSVVVYDSDPDAIRAYIKSIRTWVVNNQNSLYYLKVIKPVLVGPLVPSNFEKLYDKVFQQNLDFTSRFNLEKN